MTTITRHRVVGMQAGSRTYLLANLQMKDPVLLMPEPDNPYDPFAIAVFHAPQSSMTGPIVSSAKADDKRGSITDTDRSLLLSRHAGYLPRAVAEQYLLPDGGIVGWVSAVRYPPEEQWLTDDGSVVKRVSLVPAGFDVGSAIDSWRR